jgi:hypothetical protein
MRVMGTRLSFGSLKVAARDRAAFARRGSSEGASETRAPRRNEGVRSLAAMEYHVQSSTDVYLACESIYDLKRLVSRKATE